MKNLVYFLCLTLTFIITSCEKRDVEPDTNLVGKWKVISNYTSSGGPGEWHDVSADQKIFLEFKADGTLAGDNLASNYATYIVKDSTTLTLTKRNSNIIQNYSYKIGGNFLTLSPAGPIFCIEGCATKYIKQ